MHNRKREGTKKKKKEGTRREEEFKITGFHLEHPPWPSLSIKE